MNFNTILEIRKFAYIILPLLLLGTGNSKAFAQDVPEQVPEKKELKEDEIHYSVELRPEFPGGIQKFYDFIGQNFKAPEKNLTGKVFIQFVVEIDGSLTNFKVLRDIGHGTGKEALRVLKLSPNWIPGEVNGKKVRVVYTLPITIQSR